MSARNITITSWLREPQDPPLAVAVPGMKFTGWWQDSAPPARAIENIRLLWPNRNTAKIEADILEDSDLKKHQLCAYIRIHEYPEHWLQTMNCTLESFIEQGAAIAWAGGWDCFLHY